MHFIFIISVTGHESMRSIFPLHVESLYCLCVSVCMCVCIAFLLLSWLSGKEIACNAGDARSAGLIPGSGRCPGGGNGTHFSILAENFMNRGAWWSKIYVVTKESDMI